LARKQLEYYNALAQDPRITLIRSRTDIDPVLNPDSPRLGAVLLMEGADPIVTPKQAQEWFEAGVRIVGPAWRATRYAGGTQMPGPLTGLGRELMKEMEKTGLILDVSHMAEASFFEALELFHGPVIASHSNCRTFVPTDRQLSDEMISALGSTRRRYRNGPIQQIPAARLGANGCNKIQSHLGRRRETHSPRLRLSRR